MFAFALVLERKDALPLGLIGFHSNRWRRACILECMNLTVIAECVVALWFLERTHFVAIGECFGTLRFLERYTGAQRYELGSDTRSLRKSW